MAAELADTIQDINCENTLNQRSVDTLTHIYLVNHLEGKDARSNSHNDPNFAKVLNDDSDEDKDEDCGHIETEAPGGNATVIFFFQRSGQ